MKESIDARKNIDVKLLNNEQVFIVASRVNNDIVSGLLQTAKTTLAESGVLNHQVSTLLVPGAFEIPFAASQIVKRPHGGLSTVAVVALGCVIEGKTDHFRLIVDACAQNLQSLSLKSGVPIGFGILAVKKRKDAVERMHYARQAVLSVLEMYSLAREGLTGVYSCE